MNATKSIAVLAAVTLVLTGVMIAQQPATPSVSLPPLSPQAMVLGEVTQVAVSVMLRDFAEPRQVGTLPLAQSTVEGKLREAGITVVPAAAEPGDTATAAPLSMLNVQVDRLKLDAATGRCVLHVHTSLVHRATIVGPPERTFMAPLWFTSPQMEAVEAKDAQQRVLEIVTAQTETFIRYYRLANLATALKPKPKDAATTQDPGDATTPKPTVAPGAYVASKNSEVFHTSTCRSAKAIAEGNVVTYPTRDAAIADGKRPCQRCNP